MVKVPEFKNRQEAREFFDSHSVDELEEFEEVDSRPQVAVSDVFSIRLSPDHTKQLAEVAARHNIRVTTMARELLVRALEQEEARTAGGSVMAVVPQEHLEKLSSVVRELVSSAEPHGVGSQDKL